MERTLNSFVPGERGTVLRVNETGAIKRRLFDMGITPGAKIEMRKAAPMGDPIEINVRGYELSIRRSEASAVVMKSAEVVNS